jgi:uncharacterized membrane protein
MNIYLVFKIIIYKTIILHFVVVKHGILRGQNTTYKCSENYLDLRGVKQVRKLLRESKSRRLQWVEHVARVRNIRCMQNFGGEISWGNKSRCFGL